MSLYKYNWTLKCSNIWGSFDNGTVIAENDEQARELASNDFWKEFTKVQEALIAIGNDIDADSEEISIERIEEIKLPKTIRIAFWYGSYDCPYESGQEIPYSKENLSEIITNIIICGLNSMVQTTGITPESESIIVWIDDRKFTQR